MSFLLGVQRRKVVQENADFRMRPSELKTLDSERAFVERLRTFGIAALVECRKVLEHDRDLVMRRTVDAFRLGQNASEHGASFVGPTLRGEHRAQESLISGAIGG